MKKFLYLVQTRIARLNQYRDLVSIEADVIYLTFEEKIDQPNYIYAPNTDWTEGRNCLIEAAKKRGHYEYYIFLDDDLEFKRGNFRLFEQELLAIRPDFAMPVYQNNKIVSNYEKLIKPLSKLGLFRCSHLVSFDSAFVCLSRALFCDDRLLPYHTQYQDEFENSYCGSQVFWLNLFEYHSQRKLYMINRVKVKNTAYLTRYNRNFHYSKLKQRLKHDQTDYQFLLEKHVPSARPLIKERLGYKVYKRNNKEALGLFMFKVSIKTSLYAYVYIIALYKDMKLAIALLRQRQQSADGGGYNKA